MATVEFIVQQEPGFIYDQKAPSQASRTNFTPGKASAKALDQNWPVDFHTYVGIPVVDALMDADKWRQTTVFEDVHARKADIGLPATQLDPYYPTNPIAVQIQLNEENDAPIIRTDYTETETLTQNNNGQQEHNLSNLGFIQ